MSRRHPAPPPATASIQIDLEFKSLIPPPLPEEVRQLEENLRADGCRDPLAMWRGLLLDGHNRYEICERHGIAYTVREIDLPDRDAAMAWIIRNQFGRRNLMPYQRAELAMKLEPLIAVKAKANEKTHTAQGYQKSENPVHTAKELGKVAGISHDTIHKAKVIAAKAPEPVKQKLRAGEVSINAAYRDIKKSEQKAAKAKAKAVDETTLPAVTDRWKLYECRGIACDVSKVSAVEPASVDWIITDPPYPKDDLHCFAGLAELSEYALKPGGSMLVMVGQSYLPDIFREMGRTSAMRYQWTCAYLTPGGQAVQLWERKVNAFWKPLLWYVKGQYAGDWIGDVCRSATNDNDKRFHGWGQSETGMADIIERFTYPGQLILDPFVGGGTTGVVAVKMGRKFIGLDIDAQAIEVTKRRLTALAAA